MATIVKLKGKDLHAILLGVGYGMHKSARPSMIFGDLLPNETSGESMMAAVSSADGTILWCRSEDLEVVSVDGIAPSDILLPHFSSSQENLD